MDDETYPDAQFSSEFSETEDTSTPNTDNPALTALAPPPTSMNKNTLPIAQFNSESTVHGGGFAPQDLQSNIPGQSVVAERAVYWSLNPSGVERLSTDEARDLGFPAVELETDVYGHSWNGNVYVGLHQFHRGKGFDPDSQELAQHLGYPLYQLSEQLEGPFAHVASEEETFGGLNYVESNPTLPRDSAQISGLSIELEGCPATDIAMIGAEMPEPFQFDAEMPTALSWAWKLVTAVKLMLMTYLAISWVYERVQEVVQGGM
ncbi:hypothetical protein B0H16DRAFT_1735979 [Mycena metata]|uniref:Uncharacterized protein n=1 Tax=Mycena metata TaxID=1033252 RepID=A0AAD7HQ90_9AGAR|nr:hypothetical protein B0H16DRAFT_1735979 [Mycena metata]